MATLAAEHVARASDTALRLAHFPEG